MILILLRFARVCSSYWEPLLQPSRVKFIKKSVCERDKRFLVLSMKDRVTHDGNVEGVNENLENNVKEEGTTTSVKRKRIGKKDARGNAKQPKISNEPLKEQIKMFKLGTSEEAGQSVLIGSSSGGVEGKREKEVETLTVGKNVDSLKSETKVEIKQSSEIESESECAGEDELTVPFIPFEGTNDQTEYVLKSCSKSAHGGRFYNLQTKISKYMFPSVTTILENTKEKKHASALLGWNLNQIKIHGHAKHSVNIKKILNNGSKFHKKVEDRLLGLMSEHDKLLLPKRSPVTKMESNAVVMTRIMVERASKQKQSEKQVHSKTSAKPSKSSAEPSTRESGKATLPESMSVSLKDDNSHGGSVTLDARIPIDEHSTFSDEWLTPMPDMYADDDEEQLLDDYDFYREPIVSSDSLFVCTPEKNDGFQRTRWGKTKPLTTKSNSVEHEKTLGSGDAMAKELEVDEISALFMQSVEHVLSNVSNVVALEIPVIHLDLGYAGTVDCVAKYKGEMCVIDWKTSRNKKVTLEDCYDYPLQLVAYAGAINQTPKAFSGKLQNVMIVVANADGSPAHTHFLNIDLCKMFWLKWLKRVHSYHTGFSGDLSGFAW